MRWVSGILGVVLVFLLGGCAGYRLGPTADQVAGARSVQIQPFFNKTLEPRLSDAITSALRKEIQHDGTFTLASQNDGDIIVSGDITSYQRTQISFLPTDITTAQDYKLNFTAHVIARERITGRVVMDQTLTGTTLIRVGSDLPSAERQSLPLLAADLARQIAATLADGKW
jgi:hypothetical protein